MIAGGGLRRAWPLLAAAAYGPVLVAATGLVPAWGRWYTASPFYREQVDALLHGRLALSADPAALRHDLAWAGGGVQQVWGLGVPLWRLVPEAVARWLGAAGFPGMVCFALALSLAAWLVVRALRDPGLPGPPVRSPPLPGWPLAGGALLLLGAPPFVNLLHSRFDIWEEAVAYEYIWGLALAAALVRLAVRPTPRRLGLVCVLAGWGGLVRPTLALSGIGALAAAAVALCWRRDGTAAVRLPRRAVAAALAGCLAGWGVLYATNLARFGDGFAFGHQLNLQFHYGSLYATRFDHPFAQEPLPAAARELFGLLFRVHDVTGGGFYRPDLFPGQSPTLRWREVYLTTFDFSHLALLGGGWLLAAGALARRPRFGSAAPVAVLGVYAAVGTVLLAAFLLRVPVISSRYMLDLMPVFAGGLLAAWLGWCGIWQERRGGTAVLAVSLAVLLAWTVAGIVRAQSALGPPQVLTRAEVEARRRAVAPVPVALPHGGCYRAPAAAGATGIPYNGAGWDARTGRMKPCVILFVDAPEFLELEVAACGPDSAAADPALVRAKIGLESLKPSSRRRTDGGWLIRFAGPRQDRHRSGLQPVFVATVPAARLADRETPWRLLQARWRPGAPPAGD